MICLKPIKSVRFYYIKVIVLIAFLIIIWTRKTDEIFDEKYYQLIDLKNFQFIINLQHVCEGCKHRFLLVILVHSSMSNIKKRTAIRETWGQQSDCVKVLYFMGASDDKNEQRKIQEENDKYHDIIQGNFMDTYRNLTYKHVMVLKWATNYCQKAKYIVKTDDDILVNIDVLYDNLKKDYWGDKNLIACVLLYNSQAQRNNSKWVVTKEEYPEDTYPDYCFGPFIIYSADVVHRLLQESYKARYFWIDDVHVSGTLAKRIGFRNFTDFSYSSWYLSNKEYDLFAKGPTHLKPFLFGPPDQRPESIYRSWKALKGL